MIRMAGAAIRSPGQHGIGMETLQLCSDAIRQPIEQRTIADVVPEFAVRETEENWWLSAKGVRRTARLFAARPRERVPAQSGGRPQRAATGSSALRAIGRDDEVHLDALPGVAGQNRCDRRFVVSMRKEDSKCLGRASRRGLLG